MNKAKKIKIFMILVGVIAAMFVITFMILNHYIFDLKFVYVLGICLLILVLWIIINYIGIRIIISRK